MRSHASAGGQGEQLQHPLFKVADERKHLIAMIELLQAVKDTKAREVMETAVRQERWPEVHCAAVKAVETLWPDDAAEILSKLR